jgi:transposase
MLCDALGNPVHFEVTAGNVHDSTMAEALLEGYTADYIIADKGYIKPKLFERIEQMNAQIVIPSRSNQLDQRKYDKHIYKDRNLIERLFSRGQTLQKSCNSFR